MNGVVVNKKILKIIFFSLLFIKNNNIFGMGCLQEINNKVIKFWRKNVCPESKFDRVKRLIIEGKIFKAKKIINESVFVDKKFKGYKPVTVLHNAISRDIDSLAFIIPYCSKNIIKNGCDSYDPPIYWACRAGDLEMVKILLLYGADVTKDLIDNEEKWSKELIINSDFGGIEGPVEVIDINELKSKHVEIKRYINLTKDYNYSLDRVKFVLDNKQDSKAFDFLVRLSFGRFVQKMQENKSKAVKSTAFCKLYEDDFYKNEIKQNFNKFQISEIERLLKFYKKK